MTSIRRVPHFALILLIGALPCFAQADAPPAGAATGKAHTSKSRTAKHATTKRAAKKRTAKTRCTAKHRRSKSCPQATTSRKRPKPTPAPAPAPEPAPVPAPDPAPAPAPAPGTPESTWTAVGSLPLSDAQAAALVTPQPEVRADNAAANAYVPSDAELSAFHTTLSNYGQTPDQYNPLYKYVTGRPGLTSPSTDDLIQWTGHKWGIPEDWIRAEMVNESYWHQSQLGDRATVSSTAYYQYPAQSRIPGTWDVYESLGITQIKWRPGETIHHGTEPLRWKSTAFSLDYYGATIRYYYDGYCRWCGTGYAAGQQWASIGAWYNPSPWNDASAQGYVSRVQQNLAARTWAQPGF